MIKSFAQRVNNFKIGTRINIGFSVMLLAMIAVSIMGITGIRDVIKSYEQSTLLNQKASRVLALHNVVLNLQKKMEAYTRPGRPGDSTAIDDEILLAKREMQELKTVLNTPEEHRFLSKMESNLRTYADTFELAKQEMVIQSELIDRELSQLEIAIQQDLDLLSKQRSLRRRGLDQFEVAFVSLNRDLRGYLWDSDYVVFENSFKHFKNSIRAIKIGNSTDSLRRLASNANGYAQHSYRVVQATRGYMFLENVVMAAQAEEFKYRSEKLKEAILSEIPKISDRLDRKITQSQSYMFLASGIFIVFGILFSNFVARGISRPIDEITSVFSLLATGVRDMEIPELRRKDEIGSLSMAAGVFQDKNREIVELFQELESSKEKLERSNEELQQFAYRTSHDLKAPLMTIRSLTDVIIEDIEDGDQPEAMKNVERIRLLARDLETLVADILDLTRLDYVQEKRVEISLPEIIQQIEEKFAPLIEDHQVEIKLDPDCPASLVSEPTRLRSIFENLISNAIKYSDPDQQHRWISIRLLENSEGYLISVGDNGLGIPKQYHAKIFTMFGRAHSKIAFGSGLGLYSIKKQIVKLGGEIWFESLETGTIFYVSLPKPEVRELDIAAESSPLDLGDVDMEKDGGDSIKKLDRSSKKVA